GLIQGNGDLDIAQIAQLVSGLIGGNIGGGLGGLDIAVIAELVGGLIQGNGDLDIAQIAQLASGLIGGNIGGDLGGLDIAALEPILALLNPEGQLASDFDLGGLLNNLTGDTTGGFSLDGLSDDFDNLIFGSDFNISDLLQGASSTTSSEINIDSLVPALGDALGGLTGGTSDTQFDLATLPNLVQTFDLNNLNSLF
ncbi:hypothetical protein VXQ01_04185, partial [Acinetobacter towneri]